MGGGFINGDGHLDLAVLNFSSSRVFTLFGDGLGTFTSGGEFSVGALPTFATIADLNGDSYPDIVTANTGDRSISVLLNDGTGTFSTTHIFFGIDDSPYSVAAGDLNLDGKQDIAAVVNNSNEGGSLKVLLGNGDGSFQTPISFFLPPLPLLPLVPPQPTNVVIADVNTDGRPDVVTAGDVSVVHVYLNTTVPPLAADDSYSTNEDTALNIAAPGVLANDTDADLDPLTAVLVSGVSHGTLILNADGSFSYTPAANYNGPDSFTYTADDGLADSNVATVFITVNPVNDPPVAFDDSANTPQDIAVTVAVLDNDVDPDGNTPLTVANLTQPANGTAVDVAGGVMYTPALGFFGTDSFTYQARDSLGALSNVATVTVNVQKAPPVANPDSAITNFNTAVTIPVLANDTGGAVLVAPSSLTQPLSAAGLPAGTVAVTGGTAVTYTPANGFSGTAAFRYQALDNLNQLSNSALVTVTVNPPPVAETITATANALVVVRQGVQTGQWTINGTITPPSPSMTVRLTRTGALIGIAVPDRGGRWRISARSSVIPVAGDTITVRSFAGTEAVFPVTVR